MIAGARVRAISRLQQATFLLARRRAVWVARAAGGGMLRVMQAASTLALALDALPAGAPEPLTRRARLPLLALPSAGGSAHLQGKALPKQLHTNFHRPFPPGRRHFCQYSASNTFCPSTHQHTPIFSPLSPTSTLLFHPPPFPRPQPSESFTLLEPFQRPKARLKRPSAFLPVPPSIQASLASPFGFSTFLDAFLTSPVIAPTV